MMIRTTLLAISLLFAGAASAQDASDRGLERVGDHAIGAEDAPVLLIEYASVACPHCATWHNNVWPMVNEEFVETGRVRFVVREMLTGSAPLALAGFMTAQCAADDLYFDAIDLLFTQQAAIFEAAQSEQGARGEYVRIAQAVGMSEADFDACISNDLVRTAVIAAHEQGSIDEIAATPTFIINNNILTTAPAPDGSSYIYFANGEPLVIDGEYALASVEADSFRRIIEYFESQR